jgi:hypothetical protein
MELQELKNRIEKTIECNTRYCKSYFWKSNQSAGARRYAEAKFASNYPDYKFEYEGDSYEVKHRYDESCSHCYFKLIIFKNENQTNITVLKTVLKKLSIPAVAKSDMPWL